MRQPGILRVIAAGALWLGVAGPALAEESPRPPTELRKVGDHWTAWDPPPPAPDHYIIQKGDTLWDLAERWFSDPFLWPQIWDANRYILDSHWIYPGDPLVVPGRPTVVPADTPPPVEERPADVGVGEGAALVPGEGDAVARVTPPATPPPTAKPLMPAADPADLYCSGYIAPEPPETELRIAGNETERESLGQGDVVFFNRGRNAGLRAGDTFGIIRPTEWVQHPITEEPVGIYVRDLGRARILIAHEASATALIEMSCEDVRVGDLLETWQEIPVPLLAALPEFDRLDPEPAGGPSGSIVWQRDQLSAFGTGHVIYTDLGRISGAAPGDFLRLYRERAGDLPRMPIGNAVILTVGPDSSMAKITYSVREGTVGDRVELLP